ncbi:MAG: UDP-N-acetylmuramate dehydrogenase [Firmicutes bacterium]|nr:UDP-N-acetylmuramate dehydrogenase [Bacillota bacterium]
MIYEKLTEHIGKDKVLKDVPLKEHISFKVGGPCKCMVFPSSAEEISKAVEICRSEKVPYYVLGNGTNVIALDEGYKGVIIKIGKNFGNIAREGNCLKAQSGVLLSNLSKKAYEYSLTGLEFAGGIPGSVGGGIMMNAGAYGGELKNVVRSVTALSCEGEVYTMAADECEFEYRNSVFQKNGSIVLEAEFELAEGDQDDILAVMQDLAKKRTEKQPLNYPSAGSTFKRPEGHFAGKLIQDSGLKGICIGGAQVSELHAGFVINKGGASASDILELIELVKNTVYDKYDVMLHPEVRVIE